MFWALLVHPQELLHMQHLVYCIRVMSVGSTSVNPGAANWHNKWCSKHIKALILNNLEEKCVTLVSLYWVFVLSTRIFLFLQHFCHLNFKLCMRLLFDLLPQGKHIFWLLIGTSFLIHREIMYYVSDSRCIKVLHKPSFMSAIPPHIVNVNNATKFAQTQYMYIHTHTHKINGITQFSMVCLIVTAIQKSCFSSSSSQCIWECSFFYWLAIIQSGTGIVCMASYSFLYSHLLNLQVSIYVLDCRQSSSHLHINFM
jgi:hypothetical protein